MHQHVARPRFAPSVVCARGVYEAPWFSIDRQSVVLLAVDSAGCVVAWTGVRDAGAYAAESERLTDLLDEMDAAGLTTDAATACEALQLVR